MTIGIAGTGRLARVLGKALQVHAVAGRDASKTANAAYEVGCLATSFAGLARHATHILIAVSDAAIGEVAAQLTLAEGVVLHTSGALGAGALEPTRTPQVACGTFHPLQTFSGGGATFQGVTFAISGDAAAIAWAGELATHLGGKTLLVPDDQRPAYHAAATLAGNGIIGLVDAAARILASIGISRNEAIAALAPLMRASLENALSLGPEQALTGPVSRGDAATIGLHLNALPASHADLYREVSKQLLDLARRRGLEASLAQAVQDSLNGISR